MLYVNAWCYEYAILTRITKSNVMCSYAPLGVATSTWVCAFVLKGTCSGQAINACSWSSIAPNISYIFWDTMALAAFVVQIFDSCLILSWYSVDNNLQSAFNGFTLHYVASCVGTSLFLQRMFPSGIKWCTSLAVAPRSLMCVTKTRPQHA